MWNITSTTTGCDKRKRRRGTKPQRRQCVKKWPAATFLRYALGHWSLRSRPFLHGRKLFLRKSTKIAAQGHRPVYRPDGARRFSICRLPTANDCD